MKLKGKKVKRVHLDQPRNKSDVRRVGRSYVNHVILSGQFYKQKGQFESKVLY